VSVRKLVRRPGAGTLSILSTCSRISSSYSLQDIAALLQDMNATQNAAESEKAAIDAELHRIQQLLRFFQERMNEVSWIQVYHLECFLMQGMIKLFNLLKGNRLK